MIPFRSSAGISSLDMYRLRILNANSAYGRSFQLCYWGISVSITRQIQRRQRLREMCHVPSPRLWESALAGKDRHLERDPSIRPSRRIAVIRSVKYCARMSNVEGTNAVVTASSREVRVRRISCWRFCCVGHDGCRRDIRLSIGPS